MVWRFPARALAVSLASLQICRCAATTEIKQSHQPRPRAVDCPPLPAKSQIKQTRNPFPSFIAINSQLQ
jgi:hypothetical protein